MKRALQIAAGLLLALAMQKLAGAQTATVMTDKPDYAPGTIVTITGAGWQPGETVTLSFVESPLIDTHPDLYATADANGNIFNNQFSPDAHDADISFTLTATGQTSGLTAQTTFTDSTKLKNNGLTLGAQTPSSIPAGSQASFTVQVAFAGNSNGSNSCTVGLSVTTALPTGATASFNPSSLAATAAGTLTSTLTISTTSSTPAGTTSFTVQAQGTGGATNDCQQDTNSGDLQTGTGSLVVTPSTTRRRGQTIIGMLLPRQEGRAYTRNEQA